MSVDDIVQLALMVPLSLCFGTGLGIFLCAVLFGVDLTTLFRKDKDE